jgi:hypothetical protein
LACSAVAGVYTLFRLREQERGVNLKEGEGAVEAKKLEKFVTPLFSFWRVRNANRCFVGSALL